METHTVPSSERPKIRVLVVDDSSICRASIGAMLKLDGDIEVVGEGEDGFAALPLVEALQPDLVTMDVQMPGKNGLEAVQQIMARKPVPILVVTAEPLGDEAGVAFTAIENGALDIIAKPSFTDAQAGIELRTLVRKLAKMPEFQFVGGAEEKPITMPAPPSGVGVAAFAVVSGTGGMPSVLGLVSRLPSSGLRCPFVLHQPVAREMVPAFARHIARLAKQPVTIADGPEVKCGPGQIILVLGKRAVCVKRDTLRIEDAEPNASAFLSSIAEVYGASAVAIVLAGEGTDGVEGLRRIRESNGEVIAESPLSAAIPELPAAAIEADAADTILRIEGIAERIHALSSLKRPT
jgi:two-component system, chemotaxis family, protein-glutamate methylesterase/glutaminase